MKRRPYGNEMTRILYNHYLWCKKEGRDTQEVKRSIFICVYISDADQKKRGQTNGEKEHITEY